MQIIYCGIKMAGCDSYHTEYDDFGEYMEDNMLMAADQEEPEEEFLRKYGKIA